MSEVPENVLRRIRKMLAIAEGKANIEESATAAGMVAKLMAKYNLERADVLIEEMRNDDIIAQETDGVSMLQMPRWMNLLCVPVAHLHDCEVRFGSHIKMTDGKRYTTVQFLGQKEDAIVAGWVYKYLVDEINRLSKVYRRNKRKEHGGGGHGTNMGDYREGLIHIINQHLRELRAEKEAAERQHSSGTALVVRKQELIHEKFRISYGKPKRRSLEQTQTFYDGVRDGAGVKIRQAVEGTKQGKING